MKDKSKRRQKLYYSDIDHPNRLLRDKENKAHAYDTLAGAQRDKTDEKTNCAIPSDSAVAEMRDWCEENRQ